jgi:hypothetical protein
MLNDIYFVVVCFKLVYQIIINQIMMINYFYRYVYYKRLQLKQLPGLD